MWFGHALICVILQILANHDCPGLQFIGDELRIRILTDERLVAEKQPSKLPFKRHLAVKCACKEKLHGLGLYSS
jgi:hypothetical protein